MDFITQFNRALSHQKHDELIVDDVDINEQPRLKTSWPLERTCEIVHKEGFYTLPKRGIW